MASAARAVAAPIDDGLRRIAGWLDGIDPGARRRIRGLRLVAVFVVANMAGQLAVGGARGADVGLCAGNFALWACLYEAAATRRRACAQLLALIAASALGAVATLIWTGVVAPAGSVVALLLMVPGAFLVEYAKRYGPLGTGMGSVIFIGQAVGFVFSRGELALVAEAFAIAAVTAMVLRVLAGPSERDADALGRCRDFRRAAAGRLRQYHDALHMRLDTEGALARLAPKSADLTAAWSTLDALARAEFVAADLIGAVVRIEITRLYALMRAVLTIGESLSELQPVMPRLPVRDRAALGLVLHGLRRAILQDHENDDPTLAMRVILRCEGLIRRAVAGVDLPIEPRVALLRIALSAHEAVVPERTSPRTEPPAAATAIVGGGSLLPTTRMAIQAGLAAILVLTIRATVGMNHALWALAASTYVISSSVADTWSRGMRRIVGTAVGVVIGLGMALLFAPVPLMIWGVAAFAMIVYSTWLPLRYDVACGAYAFALVVTLAAAGDSSWNAAQGRGLETLIGAAIGMVVSLLVLPVRLRAQLADNVVALLIEARDVASASLAGVARTAAWCPDRGEGLLAAIEAQKARFAGLRLEGLLSRDGDGGAALLMHTNALTEYTVRLAGEAHFVAGAVDPAMKDSFRALDGQLRLTFDAVLARLRRQGRPPVPSAEGVLLPLRPYLAAIDPDDAAATTALMAAAMSYTCRRIVRTLADLAKELDRRDGVATSAAG